VITELSPPQSKGRRRRIRAIDDSVRYFTVLDEIWLEQPVPEKSTFHLLHGRAKTRRAGSMGFWAVFITHPGRAFELPSGRSSS
jgi:hypothetical protein